jgi:hypothetical protein
MKAHKLITFLLGIVMSLPVFAQKVAAPYEILINEFMPAPIKGDSLPYSEYIELYNRSKDSFNLDGYMLISGPDTTVLTAHTLKSKGYVIIYTRGKTADFSKFTKDTLAVKKLGTLSNPNDLFYLVSKNNVIIDAAGYDLSFYQNVNKAEAGLSLERTRLNAPCNRQIWSPCTTPLKGTPGKLNSVVDTITDKISPVIEKYYVDTAGRTITLIFDKSLNPNSAKDTALYQIGNFKINSSKVIPPLFNSVELRLDKPLAKGTPYKLFIKKDLQDCRTVPLSNSYTLDVRVPEKPMLNELIINEVLINPETGGSRFLELYNNTLNKAFDIMGILIKDTSRNDVKPISTNFLLLPRKYVVLTEKPNYIRKRYNVSDSVIYSIISNKLPTWNESFGNVSISKDGLVLDNINYTKSWHNPLLATTDGVSLERIDPKKESTDPSNWQSAAEKSGFATPAQKNSQYRDPQETPSVSTPFWFDKNTFSPDDDGYEDALLIHYKLEKGGGLATVKIFDNNGHLAKILTANELLGTEGVLRWQGDRIDGTKAAIGVYIMVINVVYASGLSTYRKLPFALTTKF